MIQSSHFRNVNFIIFLDILFPKVLWLENGVRKKIQCFLQKKHWKVVCIEKKINLYATLNFISLRLMKWMTIEVLTLFQNTFAGPVFWHFFSSRDKMKAKEKPSNFKRHLLATWTAVTTVTSYSKYIQFTCVLKFWGRSFFLNSKT